MNINSTVGLHTGRKMPVLGLGTWKLKIKTAEVIDQAIEMGFRMIDTSGDYGTQAGVGKGIRKNKINRSKLFITSKVEEAGDAYEATVQSLKDLKLDYVDLMLIHRPPKTNAGEVLWRSLIKAKKDGLTRDIGVSNYSIEDIKELIEATGETPVVNQIEWTPFGHIAEMLEFCRSKGIIIQAYSPLTRGELLGDKELVAIANNYDRTPAQIIIRWNLQLGTVPIIKANQHHHMLENLEVFDFTLDRFDMGGLSKLNTEYSALGANLQYAQ